MTTGLKGKAALVGLGVFIVTLLGIPARATYGAQVSADEPQYLLTALSIAQDGDLDIANQRYSGAYRDFHEVLLPIQTELQPDGSRISPHNPLLPLYLAVPMRIGGWVGAKMALAALAGALAGLLVWLGVARFNVPFGVAAGVATVVSISPPLAMYATQVYPEIAAALMVTVAIAALTGRPGWPTAAALAAAVVALPWLATKYVPIAAVLAVAGAWKVRYRPPLMAGLLATLAGAGAAYLLFNQAVYGGLTPYAAGDFFVGGEFTAVGPAPNFAARTQRILGLWVDRGFGIVAWQPAYLFAVPAIAWAARVRPPHGRLLLSLAAVGWLVATFVAQTMHGWWWPGRQVVVILPALVLLLMQWIGLAPHLRKPFLAIGITGIVAYLVLAVEATVGRATLIFDFASTSNPLYQAWSRALPDYLAPTTLTWVLHGVWLAVFAGLSAYGWQSNPDRVRSR
ncbi:MAG: hypothetical protein F4Z17_08075 [Acidimicrobiia bacterium]|nr:hypothetical protein [Acidimicrobiia bacterium]